jgi:general secretion pathway protein N
MVKAVGKRSGMTKTRWILLGVALWLVFAIGNIPAIWGAYAMTRGGQLALSGVSGSLWHGQASLASFKVDRVDYSLGQLYWTLNPWSLLTLHPCADIVTELERQQIQGKVCADPSGGLALYDTDISAPAALLQPILPLPIDGQLSVHIEQMQVQGEYLQLLLGNLSWTGARINNGRTWMSLGSFAAELSDDRQGGIAAKVFHLDGPTEVDMQVGLKAGGGGSAVGTMSMTRAFSAEVQADAWISMFAQAEETDSAGKTRYRVELEF